MAAGQRVVVDEEREVRRQGLRHHGVGPDVGAAALRLRDQARHARVVGDHHAAERHEPISPARLPGAQEARPVSLVEDEVRRRGVAKRCAGWTLGAGEELELEVAGEVGGLGHGSPAGR